MEAVLSLARDASPNISFANVGLMLRSLIEHNCSGRVAPLPPDAVNWTRIDLGPPAQCEAMPSNTSSWPVLKFPDCNKEDAWYPPYLKTHMQQVRSVCTGRFALIFEDCLKIPAISLQDMLWPLSHTPAMADYLICKNAEERKGALARQVKEKIELIFSYDSSYHVGGRGNRMVGELVIALLLEAMWTLQLAAKKSTDAYDNDAHVPGNCSMPPLPVPFYHIIKSTELQALMTCRSTNFTVLTVGDGWARCNSVWPAHCPGKGMWMHAQYGPTAEKADYFRVQLAKTPQLAGHHNFSGQIQVPGMGSDAPHGYYLAMEIVRSAFDAYGKMAVTLQSTSKSTDLPGGTDTRVIEIDGKIPAHNLKSWVTLAMHVGSSIPTTWIVTVSPLHREGYGINATQIEIGIGKIIAIPSM